MSYRKFNSHILSLLHFDYPYYAETGDGLRDEIGSLTWSRSGSAKLAGSQIPADAIVTGTPKWGYRCLQTAGNNDYIASTGTFTLSGIAQVSMWVRVTASSTGNLVQFLSGNTVLFTASVNTDRKIVCSGSGISLTTSATLALNTWHYVRIQFDNTTLTVYIDTTAASTAITAINYSISSIRVGGITGQTDEFMLRDALTDTVPSQPQTGILDLSALGGSGTGAQGNVTLTGDCVMNTTAYYNGTMYSGPRFLCRNKRTGKFGDFAVGQQVMLLEPDGNYWFGTISAVSGDHITTTPDPFNNKYWMLTHKSFQVIQIPQFNTLTINSGVTVHPAKYENSNGGIVAFRCKGNCTVNGKIITMGYGTKRTDSYRLCHASLIDQFIPGEGGGVFIVCGGTFTAPSTARIGADWSGAGTGGTGVSAGSGGNGGSGYGGAGSGDTDNKGTGGSGGVGGGGGGGDNGTGGNAGSNGRTGGQAHGDPGSNGGVQGTDGGNAPAVTSGIGDTGGGGAGGSGGTRHDQAAGKAGSNVILIAKALKCDIAALSTGGEGGKATNNAVGGGGTGFCYIACETLNTTSIMV